VLLEEYLIATGMIAVGQPEGPPLVSTASILSEEYGKFLREVRGFAAGTVSHHVYVSECFLNHLEARKILPGAICRSDVEAYVRRIGKRLSRASLQHDIAAVRGLLRFLAIDGRVPTGLDRQIDTPRLYRLEQLPRALPWDRVRTLLGSIDTTSAIGLRDYAMLLLIATYGLRASEVVSITLDDINWREGILRIHQRKTSSPLQLPLTNEVSTALVQHLKRTPPPRPHRRFFLRVRAPRGVLKPTAVTEVFQAVVRRSGLLSVAVQGPHCLRHLLAVHLLKKGNSPKDHWRHSGASDGGEHIDVSAAGDERSAGGFTRDSGKEPTRKGGAVMTGDPVFSSVLAPVLARYVNLKRSLGRRFATATWTLQSLDRFLHNASETYSDLTAEALRAWCLTQEAVTSGVRRVRMLEVYNFCLYRRRTESKCFPARSEHVPRLSSTASAVHLLRVRGGSDAQGQPRA
jgi:site-specific recombinase XerD